MDDFDGILPRDESLVEIVPVESFAVRGPQAQRVERKVSRLASPGMPPRNASQGSMLRTTSSGRSIGGMFGVTTSELSLSGLQEEEQQIDWENWNSWDGTPVHHFPRKQSVNKFKGSVIITKSGATNPAAAAMASAGAGAARSGVTVGKPGVKAAIRGETGAIGKDGVVQQKVQPVNEKPKAASDVETKNGKKVKMSRRQKRKERKEKKRTEKLERKEREAERKRMEKERKKAARKGRWWWSSK